MHYFSTLFGKELYKFRTDLLSIIRSLNTVFTAIGICRTSYVACLLERSGWNSISLAFILRIYHVTRSSECPKGGAVTLTLTFHNVPTSRGT
jgi:hypothetical protein